MKEKVIKILMAISLIIALTGVNLIFLGNKAILALYEGLENQNTTTNIQNVIFDTYLKEGEEKTHTKQAIISQGEKLIFDITLEDSGAIEDGKIKIENANFKIQPIENQYIKSINTETNEIELNQILVGKQEQIEVPIKFEKAETINKEYLSQEANVKFTGNYKIDGNKTKKVVGEKTISVNWTEATEVTLEQNIEKYIDLKDGTTLIQQKIDTHINNNILISGKTIEITAPEIQNTLPSKVDVLINGNKTESEYDKQNKKITIKNNEIEKSEDEYKVIYNYPIKIQQEESTIELKSKLKYSLYTEETIEKEENITAEMQKTDNKVSVKNEATSNIYKGYIYTGIRNTEYQEKINVEISSLEDISEIKVHNMEDYFINSNEETININNSTYIKDIKLNKANIEKTLGEKFEIKIIGENEQAINNITSESEWDENGNITIPIEGKATTSIQLILSQPIEIGTINIKMDKYIQGNAGYEKNEAKTLAKLENGKIVSVGGKDISTNSTSILEDTITEGKIELSSTELTTVNKNENIQILALLKSSSEKYDLYKKPYIEIKLPDELQEIDIHSTNLINGDGLEITNVIYNPTTKTIEVQFTGEQSDFRTEVEEGIQVVINADLTFKKNIADREVDISMIYKNENANEEQYETSSKIKLKSKHGAIWYNNISGYNEENTQLEEIGNKTLKAELDDNNSEKQAQINQSFINNYENPINQITIIGKLVGKESNFETQLLQNIEVNKESCKIYYSDKENISAEDEEWQENIENLTEVKSYKLEIKEELQPTESIDIAYQLNIPAELESGAVNNQTTEVTYYYNGQKLNNSSTIMLEKEGTQATGITQENNGIVTEIKAISANKELADKEEIFEGQTIKYIVNVTNNTGKDLENFAFKAEHTNAVYWVKKEKPAEIADDPNAPNMVFTEKDADVQNITQTLETLKKGETQTFTYEFVPTRKNGNEITGKITLSANNLEEQQINTITNTIKDSELELSVQSSIDETIEINESSYPSYTFSITNYKEEEQKDVILNIYTSDSLALYVEGKEDEEDENYDEEYVEKGDSIEDSFEDEGTDSEDEGEIEDSQADEEDEEDENSYEILKNENSQITIRIPSIKAKEEVSITLTFKILPLQMETLNKEYEIYYTIQKGNNTYYSNTLTSEVKRKNAKLEGTQYVNIGDYNAKPGETIIYTAEIINKDKYLDAEGVVIEQEVSESNAKIEKAYIETADGKIINGELETDNMADAVCNLKVGEKFRYIAEVKIGEDYDDYDDNVISDMRIIWPETGTLSLNTLVNSIGPTGSYNDGYDEDNDNNNNQGNNEESNYSISGTAWIDLNKNGIREGNEGKATNMEVELIDAETGDTIDNSTTDEEGHYKFENISTGKYMVLFNYDSTFYEVTQYRNQNTDEATNSDVIKKEINGNTVAVTDTLTIDNKNLQNIDAGFIENSQFDLKLNKYINKVIVQSPEGTKQTTYNKTQLAKVELNGKYVANSNVIVEYVIEVTNEGQLPGYVNEIIDYMPQDLQFDPKKNKDWYMETDKNLHNISLSNTIINPGETKQITLTLSKQMTLDNTGTSANIAEIAKTSNEPSIADKDSTAGNRKDGEDDISKAELLISIKTGIIPIAISIISTLILIYMAVLIHIKKKGKGGK